METAKLKNSRVDYLRDVLRFLENIYPVYYHFDFKVRFFIACLAALESNFGLSQIAICNCNHVGMKFPKKRFTYAVCEDRGHAVYDSVSACFTDFLFWLQYNHFTVQEFQDYNLFIRHFRQTRYNPNMPEYVQRILRIYNQYINLI